MRFIKNKKTINILFIILLFIFSDIICENFIVIINDEQSHFIAKILLFLFLSLQIIFSPIQAGFSDSGRKKGIITSISMSFFSLVFIFFYINKIFPTIFMLFIAVSIKGIWGNTVALSWAAIADTQNKNYRGSYALASRIYAVSYLILITLRKYSISSPVALYSTMFVLIIPLLLGIFKFKDNEDKTVEKDLDVEKIKSSHSFLKYFIIFKIRLIKEKTKIFFHLKNKLNLQALFAYLLWSISMYSILISQIDLRRNTEVNNNIAMAMMIGYLTGVAILKTPFVKVVRDSTIVKWGYFISFFSLIPYFLVSPFIIESGFLLGICYYLHALGNSFLSPVLLTILSKENPHHEQGKILGLVESSDSIAFLIGLIAVMIYNHFEMPLFVLVAFSFLSFAISWVFYTRFKEPSLPIKNSKMQF